MKELQGYVATLDVLGFSELIQRDGHSHELAKYLTCINDLIRPASVKTECVVFSDSIVLTSAGDNYKAFETIIRACSAAFQALLRIDIPVRGAVAFGRYLREARNRSVFLAGAPIVEAYRYERSSGWVGILLCSSVIRQQPELPVMALLPQNPQEDVWATATAPVLRKTFGPLSLRLQPATVPYLDPDTRAMGQLDGYGIVPMKERDNFESAPKAVTWACVSLDRLRLRAPHPRAQIKYQETLRWLDGVRSRLASLDAIYKNASMRHRRRTP